jgi:hypothetical protein
MNISCLRSGPSHRRTSMPQKYMHFKSMGINGGLHWGLGLARFPIGTRGARTKE